LIQNFVPIDLIWFEFITIQISVLSLQVIEINFMSWLINSESY